MDRRRVERRYTLRTQCIASRGDTGAGRPLSRVSRRARAHGGACGVGTAFARRISLASIWTYASRDDGRALSHDALLALDDDRALNLLRYWMRTLGLVAASTARLTDALRQLREIGAAGEGHGLRIDHAGHALRSYRGLVYWEAGESSEPADETALAVRAVSELAWQGESIWRLPQWRGTFVFAGADV